jgi:PAS domain S-box-containing protein
VVNVKLPVVSPDIDKLSEPSMDDQVQAQNGVIDGGDYLRSERDLAVALASSSDITQALDLVLDYALTIAPADCGGIYQVRSEDGAMVLLGHRGLSPAFVNAASFYPPDSPNSQLVMAGELVSSSYNELLRSMAISGNDPRSSDGVRSLVIVPIHYGGKVVAAMNIASHVADEFFPDALNAFLSLAAQFGSVLSRVVAEDELRRSRENFQALFNSLDDFLFVLGPDGSICQFNPVVESRLGYTREELLSMNVLEVHPLDRRQEAGETVQAMLEGAKVFCPIPLCTKSGEFIPVETRVARGRWAGKPAIFGVSRDVTERIKVQEALRKAHDELEDRVMERTHELIELNENLLAEARIRKRAEEQLVENQKWLQSLASELSLAEERERRRIAVGIHDRLGQMLALARIKLDMAESLKSGQKSDDLRSEVIQLLDNAIEDAHSLTFELSPPVLYEMGLAAALEWLAEGTFSGRGVKFVVLRPEIEPGIAEDQKILLFQVARELLTNVVRHAAADSVKVTLKSDFSVTTLEVQDNGRGFSGDWREARDLKIGGFGLFSIHERLRYAGGSVDVVSAAGQGTSVCVNMPTKWEL